MPSHLDPAEWDFFDSNAAGDIISSAGFIPATDLKYACLWEYTRETMLERWKAEGSPGIFRKDEPWLRFPAEIQQRYRENMMMFFEKRDMPIALAAIPFSYSAELQLSSPKDDQLRWKQAPSGAPVFGDWHGMGRVMLQIDFRNYRDADIVAGFAKLLDEWRTNLSALDESFEGPADKGGTRVSLYRSRLCALGLMRLPQRVLPRTQCRRVCGRL